MVKVGLCVIILIALVASVCSSKEIVKGGPNPGPEPIKQSSTLRNRFPTNFQKTQSQGQGQNQEPPKPKQETKSEGHVKILEALSASRSGQSIQNILKRNPSSHSNSNANKQDLNIRTISQAFEDDSGESEEFAEEDNNVLSHRTGSYDNNPNPQQPNPVFPNPNPPRPTHGYGWNNNHKPGMIMYKPGLSTPPPMIFPPVTMEPQPEPISTTAPVGPPAPEIPSPSGTVVPIIGGGSPGAGGSGGDGDLPPAPPDSEDIFPPSPPEIESVGRSLPLRSNPPRARISPVGQNQGHVQTSGETVGRFRGGLSGKAGSSKSASGGAPGSHGQGITRVRQRDKVRESMENTRSSSNTVVEQGRSSAEDSDLITDFLFSDIKCFKTRTKEYFGATILMKGGYYPPYVRDRPQDPLTSNDCRMEIVPGSPDTFHMTVTDLRGCGVEQCGDYMCLTMVFPRVPTLALADDQVTTIKCLPQKSKMSDTRTISFAGDSLENRRSLSTVEGGGQDFAAEVAVFRQNPGADGLFVKRVNSGGVVQLGEPLQLRSIVRGGDGWKHSRLSDVKVWRMRDVPSGNLENLDPNDASEVITLVDGEGCRNQEYIRIAKKHPLKDPRNDLINHFTFNAFLFRGQRANEPLILTAKVHACQEDLDCNPKDCTMGRKKRSPIEIRNASAIIHEDSRLAIRVVGMKDHSASLSEEDFLSEYSTGNGRSFSDTPLTCAEKMAGAGLGGGLIVLLLCGISLALYSYIIKGKSAQAKNSAFVGGFLENGPPPPTRRHPTIQRGQSLGFHGDTIRRTMIHPNNNKPLPPPPPSNTSNSSEKVSKSEISNVAKILQKIADNNQTHDNNQTLSEQTEYECIDESSDSNNSSPPSGKKSDGVYIVYFDKNNNNKSKRPKSAPPSLKGKKGSKKGGKNVGVYADPIDSISESQTEVTEESSDDSSDGNSNGNSNLNKSSGRRTVRNVKSRSNHHNTGGSSSRHKVVSGIRRRLSSFYKDGRMQQLKSNFGSSKGGSYPSRQKGPGSNNNSSRSCRSRGQRRNRRGELSDGIYSSTQLSSDMDSAYYGSEFNDDILHEMRQLATQHNNHQKSFRDLSNSRQLRFTTNNNNYPQEHNNNNNNQMLSNVKMQLRNSPSSGGGGLVNLVNSGPASPPLEVGQTKAAHFVTRNDSSTQILIVPETHV